MDKILFDKGLAETQTKAQGLIISGAILVDGVPILKPGTFVLSSSDITIKKTKTYVSRGGLKIESAARNLNISFKDKICMDIGASTGGFTDFMLLNGAKKVYAVDVGRNLLHEKLKDDPRVVNIESVNFRYFSKELLKDNIGFVTIDVSFISLEKILPVAFEIINSGGEILALVKPQFESLPKELKKGVVRDESIRQKAIEKIRSFSGKLGLVLLGEADSEVKGPEGNIEHFLWLKKQ
ncbi:MAG: TlyA family RNA methyltransferase [Elusimicrobia bacterium]|nr:TlyA family RNA methyltransferase [Elusimicrobiota bacterium]